MEENKNLPQLGEVIEKFKGLKLDVKDLIKIFEFSQGREVKDVFIWVKVNHEIFISSCLSISIGETEKDIDKHMDIRAMIDMFGKDSIRTINSIVYKSQSLHEDLEKFMNKIGWELYPKFYRFNHTNGAEGICFKKIRIQE